MNVKKFQTKGIDYQFQFTDTFADLELWRFHDRLHEISQNMLEAITRGIPEHDQVRFVLDSLQLNQPISLPFMRRDQLTTERVASEIQRVIQSNKQFRLNDTVTVNVNSC